LRGSIDNSLVRFDYDLPDELIAQSPAPQRDASRLMVLRGPLTEHRTFRDLPQLLACDDLLVLNETKVVPARLRGRRSGGGETELLLLHPADSLRYDVAAKNWIAMSRPARRMHAGDRITFGELGEARVVRELAHGLREVEFSVTLPFEEFLSRAGQMPLPPYIHNDSMEAQQRYQTVFARVAGSVAAPTASLHFTPEVFRAIERRGIEVARITLDVGVGTFRPVTAESVDDHIMHAEAYEISEAAASALQAARADGRRIVAAGTTVVRALEGNLAAFGAVTPGRHATDLFIRPGFRFRATDGLLTNFHLPRSTLLMLVSAFAGVQRIREAYAEAIALRYRFYSFGDAMLIAPER